MVTYNLALVTKTKVSLFRCDYMLLEEDSKYGGFCASKNYRINSITQFFAPIIQFSNPIPDYELASRF